MPTCRKNGIALMMSRYLTASDEAMPTQPAVSATSQTSPTGSSSTRTDRWPVRSATTKLAAAVTATEGSDAMTAASGNAGRGQGVKRTNATFVITDAVPIVIAAWKKDQT